MPPTADEKPRTAVLQLDDPQFFDQRFYTPTELADMMNVSKMLVYRLIRSGELSSLRFGRVFRVPSSALRDFIDRAAVEQPGPEDDLVAEELAAEE